MTHSSPSGALIAAEILGESLTVSQLASCGAVTIEWVALHVQAGVLTPRTGASRDDWRFASASLQRVRRIAQMERIYDADPQLAALTADLMEEVARLRRALDAR